MGVLVIAEPAATWEKDLLKAYRLIDAAKSCGADIIKFEWTSSGKRIAERRNMPEYASIYENGIQFPVEWLTLLKGHCDEVGIEFMCTVYFPEDIKAIAPLVKRYKVSAFESQDAVFIAKHMYPWDNKKTDVIISLNPGKTVPMNLDASPVVKKLHCISLYPAPLETLGLWRMAKEGLDGFSDHSAHCMAGAIAVGAGARIIEVHIKLPETPESNPDFQHSHTAHTGGDSSFWYYVRNIREAERML